MWEMDDDLLTEELKAAMKERDEAPAAFAEAAKAAFSWRTVDEDLEMLMLAYDSSLTPAAVRGPASTAERILVFESDDVTMTLEVGAHVLMGQVVPARPDRVILEVADGPFDEAEADVAGFFLLRRPKAGPLRLKWHGESVSVVTEWVAI